MDAIRTRKNRAPIARTGKRAFSIQTAIRRIREAVKPFPKAALFELAAEGYDSVFEVLAGCIISIRTRDETTVPTARRLFEQARTPAMVAALTVDEIDHLIGACTFHEPKARQTHEIARPPADELAG